MKTKNGLKFWMVATAIGIMFSSCVKKKNEERDGDTSAATDNALAEGTYSDVNNIADQAANGSLTSYMATNNSGNKDMLSTCATWSNDTVAHVITINFGTVDCMCSDGRNRRGIINVAYTGHYVDSLSHHTITFTNYYVNDNQVLGSKTVVNNGRNAAGNYMFSITVNGQIIKAGGAGTITWTSNRTREWFQNGTPNDWSDDHYLINGSASGTHANGNTFSAVITTPLRRDAGCRHFVSGVIEVTPSGKPMRIFDFGSGGCDDQATVTINGQTYNITLR